MIGSLLSTRTLVVLGLLAAALAGLWWFGNERYHAGVRATTADFVKQDMEGAKDVRRIAEDTLRRIGDNPDVDELLRATGGLRED
jgi:hypothetical protein